MLRFTEKTKKLKNPLNLLIFENNKIGMLTALKFHLKYMNIEPIIWTIYVFITVGSFGYMMLALYQSHLSYQSQLLSESAK